MPGRLGHSGYILKQFRSILSSELARLMTYTTNLCALEEDSDIHMCAYGQKCVHESSDTEDVTCVDVCKEKECNSDHLDCVITADGKNAECR